MGGEGASRLAWSLQAALEVSHNRNIPMHGNECVEIVNFEAAQDEPRGL